MKWWQRKVRGWTVGFWYSDTPLIGRKSLKIGTDKLAKAVREQKSGGEGLIKLDDNDT